MLIAGIILLLIAYLLPLALAVPAGIIEIALVLGWILLIVGGVLWLLSVVPFGGGPGAAPRVRRRYW